MALGAALALGLMGPVGASAQTAVPKGWQIAVQHMQASNPAAALPYLEQVVRDHPDQAVFRMELAYALFQLGRDGRAQYHFQLARGATLSAEQRRAVDTTLARIAARKVWSVRLGFSIDPASNAGKGTAASSVNLGGLTFAIPNALRTKAATGVMVSAGATYRPRLSSNLEATLSLDALVKYYDDPALRETIVVGRGGLRFSPRQNVFIEGGLLVGRNHAAGAPYSQRKGVFASYSTPIGTRASTRLGFEHYRTTHDSYTPGDGPRTQLDAQYVYGLSPNTLLRARGYVLRNAAQNPLDAGWQGALTFGTTHAFKGGLVTQLDLTTGLDTRDGINALTGARRRDTSLALDAEFYNSRYQIGPFTPVLRMKTERNRSNQVLNSYSNISVSVGLRTSF